MRRRWVQIDGQLIEAEKMPPAPLAVDSGALWGDRDYAGMFATDGTPIDTRTRHRAYMRARGLTTADDFREHWAQARKSRDAFYTTAPDVSRKEDVARAWNQVVKGRKNG